MHISGSHTYPRGPRALDDVDVVLRPGVTGLLGVNGAGKSTLIGAAAGVLRPSDGTVELDGDLLYGKGRRRGLKRIGFMPQHFTVPGSAKVLEALTYLGWLRGLDAQASRAAACDLLERLDLADKAQTRAKELSGGMARRLAFAQSVMAEPDILLLDEPTTGLDPEQRAAVRKLIGHETSAISTVISSHLIEDISTLADHLLVIEQGRIVFDGTLEEFRGDSTSSDEEIFLRMLTSRRVA